MGELQKASLLVHGTKKAQLPNLPTEILWQIAETLDSVRAINALSRTSRSLHHNLNPYLYSYSAKHAATLDLHGCPVALLWAAERGREDVAKLALVPYATHPARATEEALVLAAQNGHTNIIQLLFATPGGLNPHFLDIGFWTPLELALEGGYHEVVRLLIEKGMDLRRRGSAAGAERFPTAYYPQYFPNHVYPLFCAVRKGFSKVVEVLIATGVVEVDARSKRYFGVDHWDGGPGLPAIHLAAWYGHVDTVDVLLKARVEVGGRNGSEETALITALMRGHFVVAERLIRHGADINACLPGVGKTPLMYAAEKKDVGFTRTLLDIEGIEVNRVDCREWTALTYAASVGSLDAVDELLRGEIDPKLGRAQEIAARNGWHKIAKRIRAARGGSRFWDWSMPEWMEYPWSWF